MNRIDHSLENYINILRDEHKELILDYHSFLLKFHDVQKVTSIFGNHFATCPWSSDSTTSGPDSCSCYYFHTYIKKLNEIMDWYEKNICERK